MHDLCFCTHCLANMFIRQNVPVPAVPRLCALPVSNDKYSVSNEIYSNPCPMINIQIFPKHLCSGVGDACRDVLHHAAPQGC